MNRQYTVVPAVGGGDHHANRWAFIAMIDAQARRSLSQHVRQLVTGRMTNDAFDDVYYELYAPSQDLAVREIARSCWALYSSDLPLPYRLRGRYAVNAQTRRAAARSVLFLRSGLQFEWPETSDDSSLGLLQGLAIFLVIPLGIALTLIAFFAIIGGAADIALPLSIPGILILILSILFLRSCRQRDEAERQLLGTFGDLDVWPFRQSSDFDEVNRSSHLLARGDR